MFGMKTITDMRPRWLVLARDHERGVQSTGMEAGTVDDLNTIAMRLRGYGYKTIKSFPINR